MNKKTLGILVLAMLLGVGALELNAQQNRGMRGGAHLRQGNAREFSGPGVFSKSGFNRAPPSGPEQIMRMRDRLQLTDEQINQLDDIRRENVQRRTTAMAEMAELRSQVTAGQINRSDLTSSLQARRVEGQAMAKPGELVMSILTDQQREILGEAKMRSLRARSGKTRGMRGRGSPAGFRGPKGGRSGRPSMRGGRGAPRGPRGPGTDQRGSRRRGFLEIG
ncbi:MAG: Spy/CpxP family protein refolding chaperone [Longimicrobiales bacterium]|nr:Spy/CpxP family protein refolding chaperone [Longimicrobiales bacterium]